MENENLFEDNHMFFLQFDDKLPDYYYHFVEIFLKWNTTLVPISLSDLVGVMKGKRCHVLAIVRNLSDLMKFARYRKQYLDYAILNRMCCLYHLSSFGEISIAHKIQKLKFYYYFRLPVDIEKTAREVMLSYFEAKKGESAQKWPGGKKVGPPVIPE